MSWLTFLEDPRVANLFASLINQKRQSDTVVPPFHIQALDIPPDSVRVVVVGRVQPTSYTETAVFTIMPNDSHIWHLVVDAMVKFLLARPQHITLITCGVPSEDFLPIASELRTIVSLPDSVTPDQLATIIRSVKRW